MAQSQRFDFLSRGMQMFYYMSHGPVELVPHIHPKGMVELWCLLAGKATMMVEGSEYALQPGDLVLIRSGEVHTPVVDTSVPFGRAGVLFRPEDFTVLCDNDSFWEPIYNGKPGTRNLYRAKDMDVDVRYYYNQMRQSCKDQRMNIMLNALLLMRHVNEAYARKEFSDGVANEMTRKILGFIDENLHRELSLGGICQALFISSAQLERTVKKATGVSVGKYITAKRMSKARQLILDGQRPTQICSQCGYANYASFFRAYTKYFGHTPKQALSESGWENVETK